MDQPPKPPTEMTTPTPQTSYVGLWVTQDGRVRHELLPNGRYDEARGTRESAYQGRYTLTGDHIDYVDDTGFTADGDFRDGVLYHGGMVLYRTPRQPAAPALAPTNSAGEVAALHREWILVGWERKAGDGPLDFRRKLGKYYDFTDPNVLLYDDFDPQHRVVRRAAAYGDIWEPAFSTLRSARHRVSIAPAVLVDGTLATSTLQFEARLESKAGQVTGIRTLSSLVWHATGAGWKIVREHNSTVEVPVGEVEANLSADGGG